MSKRRILIVDDELGVRESFKMIFKDDYEVSEASNGEEALMILREVKPDVIILDFMMPGIGGVEVLRWIKSIDRQLPVIVVSAIKDTSVGKGAEKLGAFSYLTKPFDIMELKQVVQKAVKSLGPI